MQSDSKPIEHRVAAWIRSGKFWAIGAALLVLAGACMTLTEQKPTGKVDRGLRFSHELHAVQAQLECDICHSFEPDAPLEYTMPSHDVCSVCHDIPPDGLEPTPETDVSNCSFCHSREDYRVDPWQSMLDPERIWKHDPHVTAAELECATCHGDLDKGTISAQPTALGIKPFCMDCHGATEPKLNECSVCHTEMSADVRPKYRGSIRIPHDSPEIWERVHGRESQISAEYCGLCHQGEEDCEACHRQNAPSSHTVAWRRKAHGMEAAWNRAKCSVCHEEDQCIKCHQNTEPSSHRGGWGEPLNTHCVSCHFPPEKTGCTVCHESIAHASAMPSPHNFGIYPPNCTLCHPGGLPHRAPHVLNSTVRCVVCHQ